MHASLLFVALPLLALPACGGEEGAGSTGAGGSGGHACPLGEGGSGVAGGTPQGAWTARAPLAHGPRQETAVVELGGRIYVLGGFIPAPDIVADVEVYDPASDTWATAAPLPEPLHHANAAAVNGKLYVLGFLTGALFTAKGSVYVYDPKADAWTAGTPMPPGTERGGGAVGVIGGKIHVAVGFREGSVADASAYDPASDTWAPLPDLPEARDHLAGAAVNGVFYAIGGRKDGVTELRDRVDAFDPALSAWCSRRPMPTPRGGAAAGVVDGRILVVGGEGNAADPSGVFSDAEAYDPAEDRWAILTPMLTPRHGTGAAGYQGKLYVPGGATKEALAPAATNEALAP